MITGNHKQDSTALTTKAIRVLLVSNHSDDSLIIGHLLAQIKGVHYVLRRAESLKQGIQLIGRNTCDVVLLNYFWDSFKIGGRFVKKAKSVNAQIPLIVYSTKPEALVEQQIITLGASDYLIISELNARILDRALRFAAQRKVIEQRLECLANYDFLTQLPNRMLYQNRLRQLINIAERECQQFALMLVDINNFKRVNDDFGHEVGDSLLKAFAARLKRAMRRNDMVARVGGDEFTLLFSKVMSKALAEQLVFKVLQEVKTPLEVNGDKHPTQCSIGIAMYPLAGGDMEQLQRHADIAMYHAKQETGNSYCFYHSTLDKPAATQDDLNRDFVNALAANQIGLYFNPRIDCSTDRIVGIEVNPYWEHPEKGMLEYDSFDWRHLDTDMSSRFIEWLLATGLEYFKQLSVLPETKLIFNIDFNDLLFPSFSQMVSSKLKGYAIGGDQIEFDLANIPTEHQSRSMLTLNVTDLERLGVSFGLNDFGSDNLPLLCLEEIPISILKLDRRFIHDLKESNGELARAFVQFAHSLGKKIVIEGKHNELPVETIRSLGFDYFKSIFSVELASLAQFQTMIETPYSVSHR